MALCVYVCVSHVLNILCQALMIPWIIKRFVKTWAFQWYYFYPLKTETDFQFRRNKTCYIEHVQHTHTPHGTSSDRQVWCMYPAQWSGLEYFCVSIFVSFESYAKGTIYIQFFFYYCLTRSACGCSIRSIYARTVSVVKEWSGVVLAVEAARTLLRSMNIKNSNN